MNAKGDANRSVMNTKRRLSAALAELMLQKPVQQITVRELTQKAGVSRGTFYFHYYDIYALLDRLENSYLDHLRSLTKELVPGFERQEVPPALVTIFRFLDENDELSRALCGPNGRPAFMEEIRRLISVWYDGIMRGCTPVNRREYLVIFTFEGFMGVVRAWWLRTPREPPEMIAEMVWRAIGALQAPLQEERRGAS